MHVRDQLGGEAQGWASVTPPPLRPAGVGTRPWRLNSCNQLNPSRNASTPPLQHSLTHSLTANLPLFHFGSCTYTLRARPQHDWCWEASLDEAAPSWLPIRVWRWEPVVLVLSKRRSKRRRILRRLKETRLKKRRRWRPSRGGADSHWDSSPLALPRLSCCCTLLANATANGSALSIEDLDSSHYSRVLIQV